MDLEGPHKRKSAARSEKASESDCELSRRDQGGRLIEKDEGGWKDLKSHFVLVFV